MRKILVIMFLMLSSSYAMEMHNAVILDEKSEVTGDDSFGRAINGHIDTTQGDLEDNSKEYQTSTSSKKAEKK